MKGFIRDYYIMLAYSKCFDDVKSSVGLLAQAQRDFVLYTVEAARCYRILLSERVANRPVHRYVPKKGLMLYLPQHFYEKGVIFVHIPKNAGTSISAALYGASHDHRTALFYRNIDPEFFGRTPSFAVIRDPAARALSSYFFIRNNGGAQVGLSSFWRKRAKHVIDFDDYLMWIKDLFETGLMMDFIMRRQTEFVCDGAGRVMTSALFPMQDDQTAMLRFLSQFGVEHIPRLNVTPKFDVAITSRQRSLIEQIYSTDFDLFHTATNSSIA